MDNVTLYEIGAIASLANIKRLNITASFPPQSGNYVTNWAFGYFISDIEGLPIVRMIQFNASKLTNPASLCEFSINNSGFHMNAGFGNQIPAGYASMQAGSGSSTESLKCFFPSVGDRLRVGATNVPPFQNPIMPTGVYTFEGTIVYGLS